MPRQSNRLAIDRVISLARDDLAAMSCVIPYNDNAFHVDSPFLHDNLLIIHAIEQHLTLHVKYTNSILP